MFHDQALRAALEAFEYALETPIIPGELQSWSANAQQTCNEAATGFEQYVPTRHEQVLDEIKRQDPELYPRVTQLHEEDAALLEQAQRVRSAADKLAADANSLASYEPTVKQEVDKLIDAGIQWIIQVRKQEASLTAWYQEAFNRDRGIAD